jgi:hypothetical protein
MGMIKLGEAISINAVDIQSTDKVLSSLDTSVLDSYIIENFKKTASELKAIAPKAKDFLYFTAIMMHAAEASLIDEQGALKKTSSGEDVSAKWEINEKTGSWKWVSNDPSIKPYKNSNADIFPEAELKTAYKKWVGKPLCLDHKSNSVDFIRGVIVDTFYDEKLKRVIALCALDKLSYPDLARKVSTGVSTCVSMGTAVGKAICFDCGKVARIESDFCDHMRSKSTYGEINTDLSPIELSIVVNGADPKAKIRHIVAAANSIAKYVDNKENFVNESKNVLSSVELEQLETDLSRAQEALSRLKIVANTSALSQNNDENIDSTIEENNSEAKIASNNAETPASDISIINKLESLEEKLNNFINKMASLQDANNISEELEMVNEKKVAYFQGAGGVNEPSPKQVKYPKEDSDSIRNNQDKQMAGSGDTGSVDGLHSGDEELKKKLLRAEEDDRKMRRQAALDAAKTALKNKEAYHQGAGGVNEPTPGKPKYPKEDSDSIRDKEDKQMNGASPFPGVGKTDGLYGDDLKTKQMLSRAKLNASFIKAANPDGSDNISESRWQVYADKKLILTATVNDIAGERSELLYDTIATKDFGKKILSTIKSEGFDKAFKLFKGAQNAELGNFKAEVAPQPTKDELDAVEGFRMLNSGKWPESFTKKYPTYSPFVEGIVKGAQAVPAVAGPAAAPEGPVDAGAPADVPSDMGDSGEPMEMVENNLNEMDNLVADMKKALDTLKEEDTSDLDALSPAGMGASASVSLPAMRKTLNASLQKGIKQAVADLEDHVEELNLIKHVYSNSDSVTSENLKLAGQLTDHALNDAKITIANVYTLMSAFVKYARGTDALIKKSAEEAKLLKKAEEMKAEKDEDKNDADAGVAKDPAQEWKDLLKEINPNPGAGKEGRPAPSFGPPKKDMDPKNFEPGKAAPMLADDNGAVEFKMNQDGSIEGSADKLADVAASEDLDLNTKEGRSQMRAKLAQKGLQFSDMLGKAHPSGGVTTKLDVKPEGDLAKVEDLEEVHDKMMDVATTAPRKVREAAETIQRLVVAGRIDPKNDFDSLVSEGLDPAAVKYWKQFYGEAKDGGSQFATELVKEYGKKKADEEMEQYRVKVARAYELAHDMADRGMIGNNREAISEQVNDLVTWGDNQFASLKRTVERTPIAKKASALPAVGYSNDSMMASELVVPSSDSSSDLKNELEAAFSGRKYNRF